MTQWASNSCIAFQNSADFTRSKFCYILIHILTNLILVLSRPCTPLFYQTILALNRFWNRTTTWIALDDCMTLELNADLQTYASMKSMDGRILQPSVQIWRISTRTKWASSWLIQFCHSKLLGLCFWSPQNYSYTICFYAVLRRFYYFRCFLFTFFKDPTFSWFASRFSQRFGICSNNWNLCQRRTYHGYGQFVQ